MLCKVIVISEVVREGALHYKTRIYRKMFDALDERRLINGLYRLTFKWEHEVLVDASETTPATKEVRLICHVHQHGI